MSAEIFNRKGLSEEAIAHERLSRAMERGAGAQIRFLFELIHLSRQLSLKSTAEPIRMFSQDVLSLLHAFQEHQVRYLLVGGFAVNAHGYSRATGDLDLWVEDNPDNRVRLVEGCKASGIAGAEQLGTMQWVPGWTGFRLLSGFEVEIMAYLAGFPPESFDACAKRAESVQLGKTSVPVLHLDDLIQAKAALKRPKDEEDLRQLRQIRELKG